MHKRYIVKLDKEERKQLEDLVKKENVAAKKRTHAQVLLLADCGRQGPAWKDEAIRRSARVSAQPTLHKNLPVPVRAATSCSFSRGVRRISGSARACAARLYGV